MPSPERCFDGRDLLLAAFDSCTTLPAFCGDFLERTPVAVEGRFLAGQGPPPDQGVVREA